MIFSVPEPTQTVAALHALKRRVYLWAVVAGWLAVLIGWLFKAQAGTASAYEQAAFPLISVLCLGVFFILWQIPAALAWIELALFAGTALSLLGRLFEILFVVQTPLGSDRWAAFADLLYWFPLVYILAFLLFESRRRLLVGSVLFFAASVALGLMHGLWVWWLNKETAELYLLSRFYLGNIIYIILLMVSVRLNEQYVRLHLQAETMTQLAHTDALLPIANRRELDVTLAREISQATRHRQSLSIILFDLDHFKHVNDVYGHLAGDLVLIETAWIIRSRLRQFDVLGRWGGEEFLVVAPQTTCARAREVAERLRQTLADFSFEPVGQITASFGVAEYRLPESPEAWLGRADGALYAAKQDGRNRVATAE